MPVWAGLPVTETDKPGIYEPINRNASNEHESDREKLEEEGNENKADRALASQENTTGRALATEQLTKNGDGRAAQDAHLAKGVQNTQTANDTLNLEDAFCSEASAMQGFASAKKAALEAFQANIQAAMSVLNAEAGTPAANGRIDYNVQLFDGERAALCSAQGQGGDDVNCGGSDSLHLTTAPLFMNPDIQQGDQIDQKLAYLEKLLFAQVNSKINSDLLQNPDTEVKSIMVESDRLRAAQGVAMTGFQHIRANHAPGDGKAYQWHETSMQEVGFDDPSMFLGKSLDGQLEFIGGGVYMGKEWIQSFINNPNVSQMHTPIYLGWNNILLYEIYKTLQIIALNTGQTVAENIDDDYEALERRIRAVNARQ